MGFHRLFWKLGMQVFLISILLSQKSFSQNVVKHKPVRKICQCPSVKHFRSYFSLGVEGGPIYSYRLLKAPSYLSSVKSERDREEKAGIGYLVNGYLQYQFHPLFFYELGLGYLYHQYGTREIIKNQIEQPTLFPYIQFQVQTQGVLMRHSVWYTYWGFGRVLPQAGVGFFFFFMRDHFLNVSYYDSSQILRREAKFIPPKEEVSFSQFGLTPMIGVSYILNQSMFVVGRMGLNYHLTSLYPRESVSEYLFYPYMTVGIQRRF